MKHLILVKWSLKQLPFVKRWGNGFYVIHMFKVINNLHIHMFKVINNLHIHKCDMDGRPYHVQPSPTHQFWLGKYTYTTQNPSIE